MQTTGPGVALKNCAMEARMGFLSMHCMQPAVPQQDMIIDYCHETSLRQRAHSENLLFFTTNQTSCDGAAWLYSKLDGGLVDLLVCDEA